MSFDPLWVPVLSHYDGEGRIDAGRTAAHLAHLTPDVRQYLIAGTTGDGWDLSEDQIAQWLDAAAETLDARHRVLVGAFGPTTDAVVARAKAIEGMLGAREMQAEIAGLTVCAPVGAGVTQDEIRAHVDAILGAVALPLAVYQLPQVTENQVAPQTFAEMAKGTDRITLFKDTSGEDRVTESGLDLGAVRTLRGAEGGYARHLKPNGRYDGWLLSTANGFAATLRTIACNVAAGEADRAASASEALSDLVARLFKRASALSFGNPFSNANRAVDHIMAHGPRYARVPARTVWGEDLPPDLLHDTLAILTEAGHEPTRGYLGD